MTGSPGFEPTFLCLSLLPPINEHGSGQETEDRHVTKARAAGAGVLGAPSGGAPSAEGQSGGAPPRSRPVPRTPGRSCTAARGSSGPLSRHLPSVCRLRPRCQVTWLVPKQGSRGGHSRGPPAGQEHAAACARPPGPGTEAAHRLGRPHSVPTFKTARFLL